MPRLDQTGPEGQGSMTGRRMGRCTNYGAKAKKNDAPGNDQSNEDRSNIVTGRGRGSGLGRSGTGSGSGRGRGRGMGQQRRAR